MTIVQLYPKHSPLTRPQSHTSVNNFKIDEMTLSFFSSSSSRKTLLWIIALLFTNEPGAAFSGPSFFRSVAPSSFPRPAGCSLLYSSNRNRGLKRNGRTSSIVFQSSIGIDSGTQLPASNIDDSSCSGTSNNNSVVEVAEEEVFSLSPLESSSAVASLDHVVSPPTLEQDAPAALEKLEEEGDVTKKVLNALLLAASFGFAAYTILNIDQGMTRGWTQSEIAMRIPLDNWLNYESSLADRPVFTKTAINVIIYLLGDWLSQTIFAKKNVLDFDAVRTLRNGFIGLCFGPLVVQYYQFSDHILPVEGGMWNRLEKILMDQSLYLTVKCSIYIAAVGLLSGDDPKTVKTNVQTKLPNIVVTAWKFWPLIHLVTYGVIPARHRILWVNCVDLVWNAILAGMTTKSKDEEPVAEETVLATHVQENFNGAEGIRVEEPLQVLQSDAKIMTTEVNDEDPFLLHQEIIPHELHAESLFEPQNKTATETLQH